MEKMISQPNTAKFRTTAYDEAGGSGGGGGGGVGGSGGGGDGGGGGGGGGGVGGGGCGIARHSRHSHGQGLIKTDANYPRHGVQYAKMAAPRGGCAAIVPIAAPRRGVSVISAPRMYAAESGANCGAELAAAGKARLLWPTAAVGSSSVKDAGVCVSVCVSVCVCVL